MNPLDLIAAGFAVFPLNPKDKTPLIEGGFRSASKDPAKVEEWASKHPECRWGVVPGSNGMVVIDVDVPTKEKPNKADGKAFLNSLLRVHEELQGWQFTEENMVPTPSGGQHYYFKKPEDLGEVGNAWEYDANGVNVRGDDGYVVAYEGLRKIDWDAIPELDDYFAQRMQGANSQWDGKGKKFDPSLHSAVDLEILALMKEHYGAHSERSVPRQGAEGEYQIDITRPGKTTENNPSASIGHTEGRIMFFSTDWEPFKYGKLSLEELELQISGTKLELADEIRPTLVAPTVKKSFRDMIMSLDEIQNMEPPEFLIDKYLVRDSLAELFGDAWTGKSFVAIDWALSIASGRSWLGHEVKKAEPILYVLGEGASGFGMRTRAWEQEHGKIQSQHRGNVLSMPEPMNLADGRSIAEMEEFVREVRPALIIFDTLSRMSAGADDNSSKDMGIVIENADRLRRASGACVLIIHHTGWQNKERGRGSSAVYAALTTDIRLSKEMVLSVTKQKEAKPAEDLQLRLVEVPIEGFDDETSCVVEDGELIVTNTVRLNTWYNDSHEQAMVALKEIVKAGGVSNGEWMKNWKERTGKFKSDAMFNKLAKELLLHGMVITNGEDGKNKRYFVAETNEGVA